MDRKPRKLLLIDDNRIRTLLNYFTSLGVVSGKNMRGKEIQLLLKRGYIRQAYIGNYVLTEEGRRAHRESPTSTG